MTRRVMSIPTPSPPLTTVGGLVLSDSEKAEALADSLEAPFQPVNDPSKPAVTDVVNSAVRTTLFLPPESLNHPTLQRFKIPFGLSKSASSQVRTVHRIRP